MRICITSKGQQWEDQFDERFGRCAYLLLVDLDSGETEAIRNPGVLVEHGAGIATARRVLEEKVDALITGRLGPNAEEVLASGGIAVYRAGSGTVRSAMDAFAAGQLKQLLPATPVSGS